jgi:hypothetical protein
MAGDGLAYRVEFTPGKRERLLGVPDERHRRRPRAATWFVFSPTRSPTPILLLNRLQATWFSCGGESQTQAQ